MSIMYNENILYYLTKHKELRQTEGETFKVKAYSTAIANIKNLNYEIKNYQDAIKIKGVGKGIAEKIKEIIETGGLKEIDNLTNVQKSKEDVIKLLLKVNGIGPAAARKFYDLGCRTIEDLKEHKLTHAQQIGVKYFDDFQERINRNEVTKIKSKIKKVIKEINPDYHMITAGSYRRGLQTCGDIDLLITNKKGTIITNKLKEIIDKLTEKGLLVDHLTDNVQEKYMGVAKLNSISEPNSKARRIDIKLIKLEEWPYALLYFTGSRDFNKMVRSQANELGYTLNEHTLTKLENGVKIRLNSEESILKFLNIDEKYNNPKNRNLE